MRPSLMHIHYYSNSGEAFPEYPGADLTEGVHTYTSTVEDNLTTLRARYFYPTGASNLPALLVTHGFQQTAEDVGDDNYRRFARYGYFVIAVEMRGSAGSGGSTGALDASGRETYDVYDAYKTCQSTFGATIHISRVSIVGFSAGGGVALNFGVRFPDLAQVIVDYYGISDYGYDATYGWWQQEPSRQGSIEAYVGGNPTTHPDEYLARYAKRAIAGNFAGYLYMFHSPADASVDVSHSQRVAAEYDLAARTDYEYSELAKWVHEYPSGTNDVEDAEVIWKEKPKTQAVTSVASSGSFKVQGMLKTKKFTVWLNDGSSYTNSGRCRNADLTYNVDTNQYTITPTIDETAKGCLIATVHVEATGYVAVALIEDGVATVMEPVAPLTIDGKTPLMWYDAAQHIALDGSGNVKMWADKTGGPAYQGMGVSLTGLTRPEYLEADINSLPALDFVAASSEYLQSARLPFLQGKANLTFVTVGTGVYFGHGQTANLHTQIAHVVGNYYGVFSSSSGPYGFHAGSAVYLVRSVLFDGSQGTNATRLVMREDKVAKVLGFSGTIDAATENGTSIFRIGRRIYDTSYFGGKMAELLVFSSTLADVGDVEDVLKTKYAI